MNKLSTQFGLATAHRPHWHSIAVYRESGDVRLSGISPAMAFDRIDVLAMNRGETMT